MSIQLRCVECQTPGLLILESGARCEHCGAVFGIHRTHRIPILLARDSALNTVELAEAPIFAQQGGARAAQNHWNTGGVADLLMSCPGKTLLNYGSGDGGDFQWLQSRGYEVTTFDVYPGEYTHYISDGHNLCFADEQFDIVVSLAVFEHLSNPFVAANEIYRVLKPGGALVGSVAFLEPYHARSYFHMSHLGISEVLSQARFHSLELRPGWPGNAALSNNLWPINQLRAIRRLNSALHHQLHRFALWQWRLAYRLRGKSPPPHLDLMFCGSIAFKAVK